MGLVTHTTWTSFSFRETKRKALGVPFKVMRQLPGSVPGRPRRGPGPWAPGQRRARQGSEGGQTELGKGQMGLALMGSLQISCFFCLFWQSTFGYSLCPTFISPEVTGCTFFPNLSKFITFAAAPLLLTPFVRNQNAPGRGGGGSRRDVAPVSVGN